jgi:Cu/Ag efflux protein CusF
MDNRNTVNIRIPLLALALLAPATLSAQETASSAAPTEAPAPKFHPLTGIVTDVMPERSALVVKHDEIPGVMRAMTMLFLVEVDVPGRVKKGDAIRAKMGRDENRKWILREVEVVTPAS